MKHPSALHTASAPANAPVSIAIPDAASSAWQASLRLGFARSHGASRLVERSHVGPLRFQKPLYPEGPEVCHGIVVHPPGGVVGGDQLSITASVAQDAAALLTTPGAAKWYRANGRTSRQRVDLEVAAGASLEWLPQETIFFDDACVDLDCSVDLASDANYIGLEILCFGRTASGERYTRGRVRQETRIRRGGKLLWHERGVLEGGSAAMTSPLGMAGKTVCATLVACGRVLPASLLAELREDMAAHAGENAWFGATQMKSVLVARYLGDASETARMLMTRCWMRIRPALIQREACVPRIWNT
ncbi:urease accessory protein UreD [Noviherbaspirillum pedocola]|uniref:Urease accessory protein UreD n=1 Tax=Noviherbaspirillum pedocola TaxID=2801341 RepID=A0A934W1U3_9BURK|nr:urease accessory protein UreD [Noviherbaspirillum pedocola]MBK4735581.1 urease accessory protein UreD [Noviherbaspirillum pedocola]